MRYCQLRNSYPFLAGLLALFVTLGCEHPPEPDDGAEVSTGLDWVPCDESEPWYLDGVECSPLAVPVDWSESDGPELELRLARLPAASAEARVGVVLVLSGGPGGSGLDDLPAVAEGLPEVRRYFDLVAHEPRTARTLRDRPRECVQVPDVVLDVPESEEEYAEMLRPIAEGIEACREADESGIIDHLDGWAQARDVDAIRAALGEERINLTAQSYGAVVVTAYAREFPHRIRAAFVDGAVQSHPDGWEGGLDATTAADARFGQFADWCEAEPECPLYGEDVRALWLALTEGANEAPIPATTTSGEETWASGAHLHFHTRGAIAPGEEGWSQLAADIDRARNGDAGPFAEWAHGNLAQWSMPLTIAMQCSDGLTGPPGYEAFLERMERRREIAPLSYGRGLLGLPCGAWATPVANPPAPLPGDQLPPFLGTGTSWDDFPGTELLLSHIPGSVAVPVEGPGHIVYLPGPAGPANPCVLEHLSRYLIELELPGTDARCDPVQPPPG
jgi:pimeloyl-ACP methyl ester carboxylesterase